VDVRQKDKIVETNLQAVLALAENQKLSKSHRQTIEKLIDLMKPDSMELGESCYVIQLATAIASNEFLTKAKIMLNELSDEKWESLKIKSLVASLAEQMNYAVECQKELSLREEAPTGFSEAKDVSLKRCKHIIGDLNPLLRKYRYPVLPLANTNLKTMLRRFENMLARFAAFSPIEVDYPDIAGISAGLLVPMVIVEKGERPLASKAERFLISQIWRGSREPVTYRSLVPGISGARVYLTGSAGSWPKVFKSHSLKDIQKEINRYRRFVHAKMPGAPLLFGPVSYGHTYAVAYEYVLQRASTSREHTASNLRPKGHPLNEVVFYTIKDKFRRHGSDFKFYEGALQIAWRCLEDWRQKSAPIRRPGFAFGRRGNGWFCFPWTQDEIVNCVAKISSAKVQGIELDAEAISERVKQLLQKYSKLLEPINPSWVHGDFHPGNIFVMFYQAGGKSDSGRLEFDGGTIKLGGAIPIDFANVTDGQNMWLDFGKYFRDLFERVLPQCLKDESELNRLKFLVALRNNNAQPAFGKPDAGLGEMFQRAKKILAITLRVFNRSDKWSKVPEEGLLALLYLELSLLCSCLDKWDSKRCGKWKNRKYAYMAMLCGVDHAARLLLS
jgi:hypothetical protein